MIYFFDNNISPKLVAILQILGVEARHLKEVFPEDTDDIDWIPRAGQEGWIILTADKMIHRNAAEVAALRQNHVTALFLKDTFLRKRTWKQAEWLIKHWQTIERDAEKLVRGTSAIIRENGRLQIVR